MQVMLNNRTRHAYLLIGLILPLTLISCSPAPAASPTPVRPTLTPFPTYQFVPPTQPPQLATLAGTAATSNGDPSLDPERVTRGQDRYTALECGTCHGANGEGTDQGSMLAGTTLSEEDFVSFLRSGGNVGSSHQYSTNRLSDSGGRNLYQYILSLSTE
jgi:mono/diheme cytochrome c family protein